MSDDPYKVDMSKDRRRWRRRKLLFHKKVHVSRALNNITSA
jgi:hypothetical protein